jgi:predicted ester cyclase
MSTAENKALVRQYFEVFHNQRQLDLGEQILGSELLTPTLGVAAMMRTAFPDYRITIDEQLAEADKVATVWTTTGTHRANGQARSDQCRRRGSR